MPDRATDLKNVTEPLYEELAKRIYGAMSSHYPDGNPPTTWEDLEMYDRDYWRVCADGILEEYSLIKELLETRGTLPAMT
jgi:hypothetical protein